MTDVAVRVKGIGKLYRIGATKPLHDTLRDTLADFFDAPRDRLWPALSGHSGVDGEPEDTIWALKDVSFDVVRGEVVGIIGRNGAGKSTLLKVLSRITEPTEGCAEIRGRVASLLEVGTGFHPELTGRENVYLNGAILGMKKAEIDRKFEEIVVFAEIEKFIDTPAKRYSTGMHVRLAFSVAAHLDPEILLVDEVLAVGDAAFQRKCLGKMGDVAKRGRTVMFVSHNLGMIKRICERSLWLNAGQVVRDGPSSEVALAYLAESLSPRGVWQREPDRNREFAFLQVAVLNRHATRCTAFCGDEPIIVEIAYLVQRELAACQIGVRVCSSDGLAVLTTTDADDSGTSAQQKSTGRFRSSFTIPSNFLAPGRYQLLVAAHLPGRTSYELLENAVTFDVLEMGSLTSLDGRLGVVAPLLRWQTTEDPVGLTGRVTHVRPAP